MVDGNVAQHEESLEDIDHSEHSSDERKPARHAHAQSNTDTAPVMAVQPNHHLHQTDSNHRAGHQPSSHTGSNNTGQVADGSTPGHRPASSSRAAGSSTDITQNSGDRGNASRSHTPSAGHSVHRHQPQRHASTTSPNSASQEHFRESGLTHELGAPPRGVQEEALSSHASRSRSQGQVNALSATSPHSNHLTPQDQVTFSPTANNMHTNEQVLNRQL